MVNALGLLANGMYVELHRCPSCLRRDQEFPHSVMGVKVEAVESYEQAIEKGWRKSNHPRLSSRKKKEWFCPSCIKELMPILLEQK